MSQTVILEMNGFPYTNLNKRHGFVNMPLRHFWLKGKKDFDFSHFVCVTLYLTFRSSYFSMMTHQTTYHTQFWLIDNIALGYVNLQYHNFIH